MAMDRPLVASAEAEEELEWQVASRRRKAWAKCRGSWQASETEDLSTEATTQDEDEDEDEDDLSGTKLPAAAGRGPCARPGSGGPGARGSAGWLRKVSCALGDCSEFWKTSWAPGRGERGHFRPLNARAWQGVSSVNTDTPVPSFPFRWSLLRVA